MKKIKAIIEKANDGGISIYSEDVNGAYGFGLTEQEAKDDFLSVLEEQAEYYKEKHGEFPVWYKSGYSVSYIYDLSGFFEAFLSLMPASSQRKLIERVCYAKIQRKDRYSFRKAKGYNPRGV